MAHAPPSVALKLLGSPDVRLPDGARAGAAVMQPRRLAVLSYLVLARPRGMHARDTILAMLWAESDQATGRHALRNCLHAIRQELGEQVIVTTGDALVGVDAAAIRCDAVELEADLAAGRADAALARYDSELLAGFHVSDAPGFERWLDAERRRLLEAVSSAAWSRSEQLRAQDDFEGAARLAYRAHGLTPDDELSLRRLVQSLDLCGDRAGAIRAYEEFAERIRLEFDAEPAAETVALLQRLRARPAARPPARLESLAVHPFTERSGRPDGTELCEGVAAGIANRLARLPRFQVTARGAMAASGGAADALAAGRAVGADAIVTGVLAASDDHVRIRVEVIRVADGRLLLGDVVTGEVEGLYMMEAHIATAVCRALGATSADQLARVAGGRPARHSEAYVSYVCGQHLFLRAGASGNPADLHRCRELFERALELDPGFAPAVAGLSNYFAVSAARNLLRPFEPTFERAIALSHEALELDSGLAIPCIHLGVKAMYLDGDWSEAERRFQDALRADPSYAEGHRFLAILRALFGRMEEALAHHLEATRLEPQVPIYRNGLASAYIDARRYEDARRELRRALEFDPGYWAARERLIRCHERLGEFEQAVAERGCDARARAGEFDEAFRRAGAEGYREARAAEVRSAITALKERVAATECDAGDRFNPPELKLALAHAELGEWDAALEWELRASHDRPWRRRWFTSHPDLAPLDERRERGSTLTD